MYYMPYSLRIPDVLQARIKSVSQGEGMAAWILEACRMRLDGDTSVSEEAGGTSVAASIPAPQSTKPDLAALREICAGTPIPDLEITDSGEVAVKPCIVCDTPMREVKGKWACADQSCAMYGREQKGKP